MSYTSPKNLNKDNLRYSTGNGLHSLNKINSITKDTYNISKNIQPNPEIKTFKQIVELIPKTYLTSLPKKYLPINTSHSVRLTKNSFNLSDKEKDFELKDEEKELKPRKRIKEIKANLEEAHLDTQNNFPKINRNYRDMMQESSKIIKEKKSLYSSLEGKPYSLSKFMTENKEITIKNFLLELLKTERNSLILTEDKISKALVDSDLKLGEDYNNFQKFTEEIKNQHKEMDKNYYDLSKEGREYYKKKKKLMQENKLLMDEVDRTVKMIYNLKEYGVFIHRVFEDENPKLKRNSISSKNIEFEGFSIKEKDLEKLTELLIEEYSTSKINEIQVEEVLEDHTLMVNKFVEVEEKILKFMESKHNLDKEYDKLSGENNITIKDLEDRLQKVSSEMEKLKAECEYQKITTEKLKFTSQSDSSSKEIYDIIRELNHIANMGEIVDLGNTKKIKKKPASDMVKELSEILKGMEFDVIEYINDIENISQQDQEKLKNIIDKRKEFNKFKKQSDHRVREEKENLTKKKKAEERMHRVILKGRKDVKKVIIDKRNEHHNLENVSESKINEEDNLIFYG